MDQDKEKRKITELNGAALTYSDVLITFAPVIMYFSQVLVNIIS